MKKGILISLLGITNIGKTTQRDLLVRNVLKRMIIDEKVHRKMKAISVKYPVYDLVPSGPKINAYLRNGNPDRLTPIQFQRLNVENKIAFEPKLRELLKTHDVVVLEMYTGTSIAYGMGDGLDKNELLNINAGLLEPDFSILLDGKRYMKSKESGHVYENDDEKTENIRKIHLDLAKEFNWSIVDGNQSIELVQEAIFSIVSESMKETMIPA